MIEKDKTFRYTTYVWAVVVDGVETLYENEYEAREISIDYVEKLLYDMKHSYRNYDLSTEDIRRRVYILLDDVLPKERLIYEDEYEQMKIRGEIK